MRYYTERLTYDEWVARGYHIKAGSKMVGRNAAGVAVFSTHQVEANTPKPYASRRQRSSYGYDMAAVYSGASIYGGDYSGLNSNDLDDLTGD